MEVRLEDAQIALDIMESSPSVALRLCDDNGEWQTVFITKNIVNLGYTREDFLTGRVSWLDMVHPEDLPELKQKQRAFLAAHIDNYTTYYRIVNKDGICMWVADSTNVIRDEMGNLLYLDCVINDHTQIMENQARIRDSLEQQRVINDILQTLHASDFDKAVQNILDRTGEYLGISRVVLFADNVDHTVSRAMYEWVGEDIQPLLEMGTYAVNYKHDIPKIGTELQTNGLKIINYGHMSKETVTPGVVASVVYSIYVGSEPYGFICFDECVKRRVWKNDTLIFLKNISKLVGTALIRKKNEESIRYMAYNDQLTGLTNRYRFDMFLEEAVAEARMKDKVGYVLFIDMDDFKIINEGYGHDYGDALLVAVANFLRDGFSDRSKVFRFGGDEFTILVNYRQAAGVFDMIEQILERARHPWIVMDREFYCTISVGVVRFPDGDLTATDIVKNADIALYQAKSQGKNSYVVYNSQTIEDDPMRRVEIEHKMRLAIENDCENFLVHFQPIVDKNGEVVGAETLVRWLDGEMMVPPINFIPLAEYLGLIIPLGEHVMRKAAEQCKHINQYRPDFYVSLNVSIRQFQQRDFIKRAAEILEATGVNKRNIVFEVTEGMLVRDIEKMQRVMEQVRAMDVRIALDDFGTGYSSLSNMRQLPLDIIKIDRAFIIDVTSDAYSKSFIRLITELSHSMGRQVCVEGVETPEQLGYCLEYGVDTIQGFYHYRPMPAAEIQRLLCAGGKDD